MNSPNIFNRVQGRDCEEGRQLFQVELLHHALNLFITGMGANVVVSICPLALRLCPVSSPALLCILLKCFCLAEMHYSTWMMLVACQEGAKRRVSKCEETSLLDKHKTQFLCPLLPLAPHSTGMWHPKGCLKWNGALRVKRVPLSLVYTLVCFPLLSFGHLFSETQFLFQIPPGLASLFSAIPWFPCPAC